MMDSASELLKSILGLFVCLGPIVAIVVWLILATRRIPCPRCHFGSRQNATICSHCGEKLPP